MNYFSVAFLVLFLKLKLILSYKDDILTTASYHVHRSEIDEENDADDYELSQNKQKKKNKEIIISNLKGLFACMDNYVSIAECDEVESFKISPRNSYRCTDKFVIIEFPFESRACVLNKESIDDNVEKAPPIGKTGVINNLKCIDANKDVFGYLNNNKEISWSEESQECVLYNIIRITDYMYFVVLPGILYVVKPEEINAKIVKRLWHKGEYRDAFLLKFNLRNETHIFYGQIFMITNVIFNISILSLTFFSLAVFIVRRLYQVLFQAPAKFVAPARLETSIIKESPRFDTYKKDEINEERSNILVETNCQCKTVNLTTTPIADEILSLNSLNKTRAGRKTDYKMPQSICSTNVSQENLSYNRKRKSYMECNRIQKWRNKDLIASRLSDLSQFCRTMGLKIDEIILSPIAIDNIDDTDETKITIIEKIMTKELQVFECLKAKDKTNISNKKYTILKSSLKEIKSVRIPGIKTVTKLQNDLNNFFGIKSNENGFFINAAEKIKFVCEKFLKKNPNFSDNKFKIKLSADSTSITRTHINLLNITFNLLDDIENCSSVFGSMILGMFEINNENYQELQKCLKEILEMLSIINNIKIGDKMYSIEFFLGSDYKMLRLLYGQKASNALEGCIWCNYSMRNVPNIDETWQIGQINSVLEPLINFIPNEKCVVDLLHLLLRITDQLYTLLFLKFVRIDKNDSENLALRPKLKIFLDFLKNNCKISNPYYISSNSNDKIKLRNFNGNERLKIFEEIYKPYLVENKIFQNNDKKYKIQNKSLGSLFGKNVDPPHDFKFEDFAWLGFYRMFNQIKSFKKVTSFSNYNPVQTSLEILRGDLKDWLKSYLYLNEKNRNSNTITPYIHVFVFHIPQMIEIHHDLNIFTTQGLEKLNDFCTQYYHGCTNKHNDKKEYLNQLFKKQNRMEFFHLNGNLNEFKFNLNDENGDYIGEDEDI